MPYSPTTYTTAVTAANLNNGEAGIQTAQAAAEAAQATATTASLGQPINVGQQAGADNAAKLTAAIALLPSTGGWLHIPRGQYTGSFTITSKDHLRVTGEGSASVIHNTTASQSALKFVDCDELSVTNLRVQGTAGTFDGLRVENCQRASIDRIWCQGSGRYGIYAQKCFGLTVGHCSVGINTTSPYPTGVTNCTVGLYLGWDGVAADSGCNQFVVSGGTYVLGKSQSDWAIIIDHADGGDLIGTIPEQTKGGIKVVDSVAVVISNYYGEENPSSLEYTTGTLTVTNGSTTVTGSGTAWNTADGEGNINAYPGKFVIVGTTWARIASVASNTSLTLEAAWPGTTAAGTAYRMQGSDLYMLRADQCVVQSGRGGGAVLLQDSSRNIINTVTESIFFDIDSNYNEGRIITNRATSSANRLVDNSSAQSNRVTQLNYTTNAEVRSDHLWRAGATELRTLADLESLRGVWANIGTASQIVMYTDGRLLFHSSADTAIGRAQAGVVDIGSAVRLAAIAAASVPNNTVFIDSADNTLKVKDNGGAVTALAGAATITTKTTSYTLALGDANTILEMNSASAQVFTIPPNSSVAFPIGTTIELVRLGAGSVTITPGSGVTIPNSIQGAGTSSRTITSQWTSASLYKRATDQWVLSGSLT